MEHQLWKAIVAVLATVDKPRNSTAFDYCDADIVMVFYWAVIHDRPTSWAVQGRNRPKDTSSTRSSAATAQSLRGAWRR